MEVADWAASRRLRGPRDRLLAAGRRRRRAATPARATSTSPTCRQARRRDIRGRDRGQGPRDLRPRLLPQPAPSRTRSIAARSSATSSRSSRRAEKMDVPLVNTFMGGDGAKNQDENWEEALRVWPDIVALRPGPRPQDHARELPDALQRTTSGRAATTSRPSPRMWRRILEQWGGTIGLNFDPSHLVLQMIDIQALPPRVRAAHPPLPGQGPDDRPRRPVRARHLLDGHRLADPAPARASATSTGASSSASCTARATRATASSSTRTAASRGPTRWSSGLPASPATSSGRTATDTGSSSIA